MHTGICMSEDMHANTQSTFLRSFKFNNAAPHKRQQTDLIEHSTAIFDSLAAQTVFFFYMGREKKKAV